MGIDAKGVVKAIASMLQDIDDSIIKKPLCDTVNHGIAHLSDFNHGDDSWISFHQKHD